MTAAKAAPRKRAAKRAPTPAKAAKSPAKKGAAPAKKAAKRAPAGAKRAAAGAPPSNADLLRADLTEEGDSVGITVLIRQAVRIVDRLDTINAMLSGDPEAWCKVSLPRSDAKRGRVLVEVKVDGILVEERNLTTLLRHVLREISRQRGGKNGDPDDDDDDLVD